MVPSGVAGEERQGGAAPLDPPLKGNLPLRIPFQGEWVLCESYSTYGRIPGARQRARNTAWGRIKQKPAARSRTAGLVLPLAAHSTVNRAPAHAPCLRPSVLYVHLKHEFPHDSGFSRAKPLSGERFEIQRVSKSDKGRLRRARGGAPRVSPSQDSRLRCRAEYAILK